MARLGPRHLDARRSLRPADYLAHPGDFGHHPRPRLAQPRSGDPVSERIALLQHHLVRAWNATGRRPSAAELTASWGVSKQTLSRCALGERWFGETVLAAFLEIAAQRGATEASPPERAFAPSARPRTVRPTAPSAPVQRS